MLSDLLDHATGEDAVRLNALFALHRVAPGDVIGRLLTLAPETRVLPGHGPEFTVAAAEKNFDAWVSAGPEAGLAADLDEDDED